MAPFGYCFFESLGRCREINERSGIPARDLNMFKIIFCWVTNLLRGILQCLEDEEDECLTPPVIARQ